MVTGTKFGSRDDGIPSRVWTVAVALLMALCVLAWHSGSLGADLELALQHAHQAEAAARLAEAADLLQKRLFEDRYAVFYDASQRQAPATLADYLAALHVSVVYHPHRLLDLDAALARIDEAITDTDALVDGYLALRFALPLVLPIPKMLTVWSRAIVRYRLAKDLRDDERSNPIVRDYRDALKLLGEVRDGKLSIGITDPASAATSSADVQFQTDSKTFGRTELGAFR